MVTSQSVSNGRPDFLGGLTYQEFLFQHWQKNHLFVANAFPDYIDCIAPNELAGYALEEQVESRIIIEHSPSDWQLQTGPFPDDHFQTLPDKNWTLLIQALDHFEPKFARLLDQFNFLPQWRIDDIMMSYAVTGGSVGPHYDYYDVFLIQISGERQWQVGQLCHDKSPLLEGLPVRILKEFQCRQTWHTKPGDMLYLPPGVAHHGVALDDDCLTLSIGFRAPSYSDLISEYSHYLGELLPGSLRYEDKALTSRLSDGLHSGMLCEEDVDRVQALLTELIKDRQQLKRWMAGYLSLPKYDDVDLVTTDANSQTVLQNLQQQHALQRDESSRFIMLAIEGDDCLFINGEHFPVPDQSAALAHLIASRRFLSAQDVLPLVGNNASLNWLTDLIDKGYLYFYEQD